MVELVSYIKGIGSLMQKSDTLVADALWETVHAEVQDFVQNILATMLRTTFRKKKDLSRQKYHYLDCICSMRMSDCKHKADTVCYLQDFWAHQLVICRILSDMRTLSADWMANTSKPDSDMQAFHHGGEESRGAFFYPRPVAPTAAQVCIFMYYCISLEMILHSSHEY